MIHCIADYKCGMVVPSNCSQCSSAPVCFHQDCNATCTMACPSPRSYSCVLVESEGCPKQVCRKRPPITGAPVESPPN
ncbi:hypothetical protein OESDEN_17763 [Oesophagostomum dentatum]|uniref:Uncharacterized protein n=1 Tax=Oesophagostomum dentatum TaxID=61180 RepID=A0A0B1SB61_OESDE|nr:hypothetical protein OESDEN_17763 [Oesophagostomum dentatum]